MEQDGILRICRGRLRLTFPGAQMWRTGWFERVGAIWSILFNGLRHGPSSWFEHKPQLTAVSGVRAGKYAAEKSMISIVPFGLLGMIGNSLVAGCRSRLTVNKLFDLIIEAPMLVPGVVRSA